MIHKYWLAAVAMLSTPLAAGDWQPLGAITEIANQHLNDHYSGLYPQYQTQVTVNAPDSRLKLHACNQPLISSQSGLPAQGGQATVKISCESSQPWHIYVSADVEIVAPVVHTLGSLAKGDRITEADLMLIPLPLDKAPRGFLLHAEEAIGMEARRGLAPQQSLRTRDLVQPMLIQRGDRVQVAANVGGLTVITPGTALNNGRLGQQISVENLRSERRIRAKVVAEGRVEVPM